MEEKRITKVPEDEIDLRDLIMTLWKWKYIIIAVTVLAMLLAALISTFCITPVYESTAVVEIEPLPQALQELPQRSMSSYQNLVTSDRVLQAVIEKLNLDESYSPGTLREKHIKVEVTQDTNLIKITINDKTPERAAQIANEIALRFVDAVKADQAKQLDSLIKFVESQIAREEQKLESEVKLNPQKMVGANAEAIMTYSRVLRQQTILTDLEQKRSNLESIRASDVIGSNISIVNKGIPDKEPVRPNTLLNIVIAGTLGLMLSIFVVFFRNYIMR